MDTGNMKKLRQFKKIRILNDQRSEFTDSGHETLQQRTQLLRIPNPVNLANHPAHYMQVHPNHHNRNKTRNLSLISQIRFRHDCSPKTSENLLRSVNQ